MQIPNDLLIVKTIYHILTLLDLAVAFDNESLHTLDILLFSISF